MLADAKRDGRKLVMLTAYDAGFARALDAAGVDLVLVGDSLGMVVQGHDSTLPVTVDDIVYHTACVARGLSRALLIADLPFQADATPERALDASTRCLQAGAAMVKLEGAGHKLDVIRFLVEREIPVCAHLGLTPQSVLRLGGYKVQGRDDAAAAKLRDDARAVAEAGAALLVLERRASSTTARSSSTSAWPSSIRPAARSRCVRATATLVLAVNGEIYNHRELKRELAAAVRVPDRLGLRGDQRAVPRATAPAVLAEPPQRHLRVRAVGPRARSAT